MRIRWIGLGIAVLAGCEAALAATTGRVAMGVDEGAAPQVVVRDGDDPQLSFLAYAPEFTGGVRVAIGDANGDGVADVVTGAGPGGGSLVRVFDGASGNLLVSYFAFAPSFEGGVYVAAGDLTGDGRADVIVGSGAGGGPQVKVFDGATSQEIDSLFVFNEAFTGGVRVATGDVNGDGRVDLIVGTGPGAGEVRILNGPDLQLLRSFLPYGSGFTDGIFVAAADVDGDGHADIVTGPDESASGEARVRVFDGLSGAAVANFFAFEAEFLGGVRVATGDLDGDRLADLVLASGPGRPATVRRLRGIDQDPIGDIEPFGPSFGGGVHVGAITIPTPNPDLAGLVALFVLSMYLRSRAAD